MKIEGIVLAGIALVVAYVMRDKIATIFTGGSTAVPGASTAPVPCPPRAGGGVFELNVPEGSAWKIQGPHGFFGPSGSRTGADWTPITGTQACIQSDGCVAGEATVFLRGPDGSERTYDTNGGPYPDCVIPINW